MSSDSAGGKAEGNRRSGLVGRELPVEGRPCLSKVTSIGFFCWFCLSFLQKIHPKKSDASPSSQSSASLLVHRSQIPRTLPPLEEVLRGSFLQREIRCGKPGCRCAKGAGRHPILYLTVTFPGGRTQQVTVPRDLAGTVRLWIRNYRRWWQAIEEVLPAGGRDGGADPGNPGQPDESLAHARAPKRCCRRCRQSRRASFAR
jgi:hypothetical protein